MKSETNHLSQALYSAGIQTQNRVLRPGGHFIWSATPAYQKLEEDVQIWKDVCPWNLACIEPQVTKRRGSKWPEEWPARLHTPPYWLNRAKKGIYGQPAPDDFESD